ncbi:MAG: LAGLIDADG family homing endonuclease [Nitrososphaerales archaeon]
MADERSDTGSARLVWPPLAEDLKRLYLEQKLSASKIAKVYGVSYASPKTAESTILYHLKRCGIVRRDPAAHVKKVTETMVDERATRYQKGESLNQIAGESIDPVTVFNHLHKRGLQLRDKVEAQIKAVTKYKRSPFTGDMKEIAYLVGLTVGDLYVQRHGRAIRVRVATTHPRMASLFRDLFSSYGHPHEYPRGDPVTGYEWSLDCDMDKSFEFLLDREVYVETAFQDAELFLAFLAGFFDAEGSLYFHKKREHGAFELTFSNTKEALLSRICGRLWDLGYHASISRKRQNPEKALDRGIKNSSDWIWCLALWRHKDVVRLLGAMPIRHPEKLEKRSIALKLEYRSKTEDRERIVAEWDSLRKRIKEECVNYIALARNKFTAGNDLRTRN